MLLPRAASGGGMGAARPAGSEGTGCRRARGTPPASARQHSGARGRIGRRGARALTLPVFMAFLSVDTTCRRDSGGAGHATRTVDGARDSAAQQRAGADARARGAGRCERRGAAAAAAGRRGARNLVLLLELINRRRPVPFDPRHGAPRARAPRAPLLRVRHHLVVRHAL